MHSLRDTQQAFASAVLSGRFEDAAALVAGRGIAAARRLQIYRNNTRISFRNTLRATFPVVSQLGGEDWFDQLATRYQERYPSRCGDLQFVGERFPAFLRADLDGTDFGYFGDIARLEWAYQEVLIAAETGLLDLQRLALVAAEHHDRLVFRTPPALRLVASVYPVFAIWQAHQPGAVQRPEDISLDAGPSRVMLLRKRDHVEVRELPAGLFALLSALAQGLTLGRATDVALTADPGLDLVAAFSELAALGTLSDFSIAARTAAPHTEPNIGTRASCSQ